MKREAKPMTAGEALATTAAMCSRGEQCESDLRALMKRRGVGDADADAVIVQLREQGFIDDERYVRAFVHDRMAYNGWGVRKVKQQLRLKHFDSELIDRVLDEAVDRQNYRMALADLLRRRYRETAGREPRRRREAAIRTAMSRGYEPDIVFELANELFDGSEDDYDACDDEFVDDNTAMD